MFCIYILFGFCYSLLYYDIIVFIYERVSITELLTIFVCGRLPRRNVWKYFQFSLNDLFGKRNSDRANLIIYDFFLKNRCTKKTYVLVYTSYKIMYFIYVCLTKKNSRYTSTDFHCCTKRGHVKTANESVKNYASYDVGCVIRIRMLIWISLDRELFVLINRFSSGRPKNTTNALSCFSIRTIARNVLDVFWDYFICKRIGMCTAW